MLQSRMLESRVWKLEATRKQCGYVRSLQIFLVFFKLRLWVSKVSRTVEICVSKFSQMAESPKTVVVEAENVTTTSGSSKCPGTRC